MAEEQNWDHWVDQQLATLYSTDDGGDSYGETQPNPTYQSHTESQDHMSMSANDLPLGTYQGFPFPQAPMSELHQPMSSAVPSGSHTFNPPVPYGVDAEPFQSVDTSDQSYYPAAHSTHPDLQNWTSTQPPVADADASDPQQLQSLGYQPQQTAEYQELLDHRIDLDSNYQHAQQSSFPDGNLRRFIPSARTFGLPDAEFADHFPIRQDERSHAHLSDQRGADPRARDKHVDRSSFASGGDGFEFPSQEEFNRHHPDFKDHFPFPSRQQPSDYPAEHPLRDPGPHVDWFAESSGGFAPGPPMPLSASLPDSDLAAQYAAAQPLQYRSRFQGNASEPLDCDPYSWTEGDDIARYPLETQGYSNDTHAASNINAYAPAHSDDTTYGGYVPGKSQTVFTKDMTRLADLHLTGSHALIATSDSSLAASSGPSVVAPRRNRELAKAGSIPKRGQDAETASRQGSSEKRTRTKGRQPRRGNSSSVNHSAADSSQNRPRENSLSEQYQTQKEVLSARETKIKQLTATYEAFERRLRDFATEDPNSRHDELIMKMPPAKLSAKTLSSIPNKTSLDDLRARNNVARKISNSFKTTLREMQGLYVEWGGQSSLGDVSDDEEPDNL